MSVSTLYHPPHHKAALAKFWIGILAVIAVGVGLAWLGAGALRPDVSSTGLEFRVIQEGTGQPITAADAALLDYVGSLDDGTVFDNSEAHGGAQPFAMAQVFPGFAEAMTRMREGGRYHFTMPKSLAFGDAPAPEGFTGENLTFDVRVRSIVRGGAAMIQQGPPQQQQQQQP